MGEDLGAVGGEGGVGWDAGEGRALGDGGEGGFGFDVVGVGSLGIGGSQGRGQGGGGHCRELGGV